MTEKESRLQRQGGQLQAGDPAFRTCGKLHYLRIGKIETHCPAQELGRFIHCELKIGRAQFHELAPHLPAGQWIGGIAAADHYRMHGRWTVFHPEAKRFMDGSVLYQLQFIEYQD